MTAEAKKHATDAVKSRIAYGEFKLPNGFADRLKGDTEEEIRNLCISKDETLCIVAQTTFNYNKFQELVEIISKKGYDIIVLNTICSATEERQTEARLIAK